MELTYLGKSNFKIKTKDALVIMDPVDKKGSADVVTVSIDDPEHNQAKLITGTSRREKPYLITSPGEYEIGGVGVFGWKSAQEDNNVIYIVMADGVKVVHLGKLTHTLEADVIEGLGTVDVLVVPIEEPLGMSPKLAAAVVEQLSPSYVVPMYAGDPSEFLKLMGKTEVMPTEKLKVTLETIPEETEVCLLSLVK